MFTAKSVIDGYVQQLVQAAASGDLETLTSHLERADSTSVSSAAHTAETDGTTALHAACETGNSGEMLFVCFHVLYFYLLFCCVQGVCKCFWRMVAIRMP